jgi:hypothetical protein
VKPHISPMSVRAENRKCFVFSGVGGGVRTHGHWNHNDAGLGKPL